MNGVAADTHAALWLLSQDPRLSPAAKAALLAGGPVYLASITLVEVIYLIEKGRIPASAYPRLLAELADPTAALTLAPLDLDVADAVGRVPRALVPDLPDRIIVATALVRQVPLVTRDSKIQAAGVTTIW